MKFSKLFLKRFEWVLEGWWNHRWPKADITYKAREDKIRFDVRNFITVPDCVLKELIKQYDLKAGDDDETAWRIMRWVQQNVSYVSDSSQFGFTEHWDFPAEVLYRKRVGGGADCEGMTHLIVSLCENAGIKPYRIKVACGYVHYQGGRLAGGHSYPIYLRRSSNEWVDLDPCFYPSSTKVEDRTPAKLNKVYGEIWFTFNSTLSWRQSSLEFSAKDLKEKCIK